MKNILMIALAAFALSNCAHKGGHAHKGSKKAHKSCGCDHSKSKVDKYMGYIGDDVTIGSTKATTFKHMSFSAQPTKADLKAAKDAGYKAIINLRDASELDWDQEAYVKELGLNYYNVPLLNKDKQIDAAAILKLEKVHRDTKKQKQLIHCSTGNRAAAWMAAHLMVKHHLSADEALQVAKPLGITKPDVEKKVKDFGATL